MRMWRNAASALDPSGRSGRSARHRADRRRARPSAAGAVTAHIRLRIYSPLGEPARVLPGMLFFHGGGWVAGSLDTHDGLCRRLSNETGCRVIAVDYRLAPDHPFPHGLADACAALNYVARNPKAFGIDPDAAGRCGRQRRRRPWPPRSAAWPATPRRARRTSPFSFCSARSWTCTANRAARRELADGYFLDRETLQRDLELYVPPAPSCPIRACRRCWRRSSPACRRPSSIPAQFDPFSDEGEAYAAAAGRGSACRCMAAPIPA